MKRWLLTFPVLLTGFLGVADAQYVILVANTGGAKSSGLSGNPMPGTSGTTTGGTTTGTTTGNKGAGREGAADKEPEVTPHLIITVVEVKEVLPNAAVDQRLPLLPPLLRVEHRDDHFTAMIDGEQLKARPERLVGAFLAGQPDPRSPHGVKIFPRVIERFEQRKRDLPSKTKGDADAYQALAEYALQHGLVKQFEETCEQAGKLGRSNAAMQRCVEMKARLAKQLPDEPLTGWRAVIQNGDGKSYGGLHFVVYCRNVQNADLPLAEAQLKRLEEAFTIWYYWWALHTDQIPPPPPYRLGVIVDGDKADFLTLHEDLTYKRKFVGAETPRDEQRRRHYETSFSTGPLVADGFVARRDALLVLSLARVSLEADEFERWATSRFDKPDDRKKLLLLQAGQTLATGADVDLAATRQTQKLEFTDAFADRARNQTLALMLDEMDRAAQRASASHNASRQLLFATGLLAPNVAAPEWVQFGLGSFFETPEGAPWACPTDLSPVHLPLFLEAKRQAGEDARKRYELLRSVVTDAAFRGVAGEPDRALALRRARANAWALTWFLANRSDEKGEPYLARLRAYCDELRKLPRDRELDEETLLRCFARAFGAWDERAEAVNQEKLDELAKRWISSVSSAAGGENLIQVDAHPVLEQIGKVRQEVEKAAREGPPSDSKNPKTQGGTTTTPR